MFTPGLSFQNGHYNHFSAWPTENLCPANVETNYIQERVDAQLGREYI